MPKREWEPVLTGTMADDALAALEAIEHDMGYPYPAEATWRIGPERSAPHSLGYGGAAIALFYCHLSRTLDRRDARDLSLAFLKDATEGMGNERMSCDFFRGVPGICWAYQHIHRHLNIAIPSQALPGVYEDTIFEFCRAADASADLMDGIAGVPLFAVNCLPPNARRSLVAIFVQRLSELADSVASGLCWPLSKRMRKLFPSQASPFYSPSVSVGSSGVIGGLLVALGITDDKTLVEQIIDRAVSWIIGNQISLPARVESPSGVSSKSQQFFPFIGEIEVKLVTSGWCGGDLGIVTVLFNAGEALHNQSWKDLALRIAREEAGRTVEDIEAKSRKSYSFCHGSSGRAHLFNRLFHSTGEALFADAARYWFKHTLALRKPGSGVGGFEEEGMTSETLLEGISGLGLTLLAAISSKEPIWDEALFVSLSNGT